MTERQGRPPGVFDQAFLIGVDETTEVLLIRHAKQDVDFAGATMGEIIDPALSDQGRQQARLVGDLLSAAKLDAIFTSTLKRAVQTAEAIAQHHRHLEMQVMDDLREVGVFRDIPGDKTAEEFLGEDLLDAVRLRMLSERSWDVYPHSESSYDFRKPAINSVEPALARRQGARNASVSPGGGVINAYVGHIIGSPYDMFFRPAHASINTVVAEGGRRVLRLLNDTHHLNTGEGDFLSY